MGRRFAKRTYSDLMQQIVSDYRDAGEKWPAASRDIARWAIRHKKWQRGESTLIDMCARDISRAMREEYHTDPQGRRVRTKHAAKFPAPGTEDGQMTLWHDIRIAPRDFMVRAFKGRRNQIVGDCGQLKIDVDSYNQNASKENPIPMLYDFTDDLVEMEQTGKLADGKSASDLATEGDAPFSLEPHNDSPITPENNPPIPPPPDRHNKRPGSGPTH